MIIQKQYLTVSYLLRGRGSKSRRVILQFFEIDSFKLFSPSTSILLSRKSNLCKSKQNYSTKIVLQN